MLEYFAYRLDNKLGVLNICPFSPKFTNSTDSTRKPRFYRVFWCYLFKFKQSKVCATIFHVDTLHQSQNGIAKVYQSVKTLHSEVSYEVLFFVVVNSEHSVRRQTARS